MHRNVATQHDHSQLSLHQQQVTDDTKEATLSLLQHSQRTTTSERSSLLTANCKLPTTEQLNLKLTLNYVLNCPVRGPVAHYEVRITRTRRAHWYSIALQRLAPVFRCVSPTTKRDRRLPIPVNWVLTISIGVPAIPPTLVAARADIGALHWP